MRQCRIRDKAKCWYVGISFYITIEPVLNDNTEGKKADSKPFEEVIKTHNWIWE